ncbi:MAG: hypothetical protein QOC98_2677 [Frankiaceae bacterium]|nr:hypothetical protein [Frankiaceae bacterium]
MDESGALDGEALDDDAGSLDAVADELYRLPLEEFISARDTRVKELRKTDRELAAAIGKLRKPSAAARVVNLLVHERPELLDQLADLAEALRTAQESLSGDQLRALSAQRHQVVASVVREARRLATGQGVKVGDAVQRELEATFDAALADPSAARAVRTGRLTTSLSYAGLGVGGSGNADGMTAASAPSPAPKTKPPSKGKAGTDTRGEAKAEAAKARAAEAERRRNEQEETVRAAEQALSEAVVARDKADADRVRVATERDVAQQRVVDLQAQLEQAQQDVAASANQVREADRRAQKAERSASAAERRLAAARDALDQLAV